MRHQLPWVLLVTVAFGLPGPQALQAQKASSSTGAESYTVVRGTVRVAATGQPVPHLLMGIESYSLGYLGMLLYGFTGDSTRTNAQGQYEIRFRPQGGPGQNYLVRMEPTMGRGRAWPSSYVFQTNKDMLGPDKRPDSREVLRGTSTTADFAPDYARPWNTQFQPKGH